MNSITDSLLCSSLQSIQFEPDSDLDDGPAAVRRNPGGGLVENGEFLRFCAYWGFRPRACRPYRAKTKGKVERPIRYVRRSLVCMHT